MDAKAKEGGGGIQDGMRVYMCEERKENMGMREKPVVGKAKSAR